MRQNDNLRAISGLSAETKNGLYNIIIETVQGSPNKLAFDPAVGLFRLRKVMPVGSTFPYDFGFIPSTRGEDGDPLDVLVLMDAPTFPGCLIEARLLGVIEAKQKEHNGKTERNDRLLAVAKEATRYKGIETLADLPKQLIDEIEHFFVQYNARAGKVFKPIGRKGPRVAKKLVRAALTTR